MKDCTSQACQSKTSQLQHWVYLPKGAKILLLHVLQVRLCEQKRLLMDSQQQCRIGAEAFPALGGNIDGLCVLLSEQTLSVTSALSLLGPEGSGNA